MDNNIPKIIHYCWFGGTDMPNEIKNFISSWKKHLGDYEFIEWNENNFDINCNQYVRQAYESRKFAHVSDYARIKALYEYGGIYMDTDVEVFKSFDDLLDNRCILGFEQDEYIATSFMASVKNHPLIKQFIDEYKNLSFYIDDKNLDLTTNVHKLTRILEKKGLKRNGRYQVIDDISIYPQEYFSPYDYVNCYSKQTKNTYTMHHYYKSWLPISARVKVALKKSIARIIGGKNIEKIRLSINKQKNY